MTAHDRILEALIRLLLRRGDLDGGEINDMASELERSDPNAAHQLRCMLVEASAPADADWRAAKVRDRFRVIEGDGE